MTTTTELLDALRAGDSDPAWESLVTRYRPVLFGVARRLGLRRTDAEDASQQALLELVRAVRAGRFVHGRDRLRCWTLAVLRNRARDIQRLASKARGAMPSDQLDDVPEDAIGAMWIAERDKRMFEEALTRLRRDTAVAEPTVRAFELFALRGLPAAAAGRECGMSREEVYVARSRVVSRLRAIVKQVESEMDD